MLHVLAHPRSSKFAIAYFFFNDTATTEIYTYGHTLALHDALPISAKSKGAPLADRTVAQLRELAEAGKVALTDDMKKAEIVAALEARSEEHTSELQSLMRISHAVFCFKKQNSPRQPHRTE